MELSEILSACDHTLLRQTATWDEIRAVCDEAADYGCASVCIPPAYVRQAAEHLQGKTPVCTVIGFPNGYATTAVKCFEAADAVRNGASEIDMVVNLGWVKDGLYDEVCSEIRDVKAACDGRLLKVIIETCLLTEKEKVQLCRIVTEAGADYIKTSTGFSTGGATPGDAALLCKTVGPEVKVKASGGIADLADAEEYLQLGVCRLGTSRVVGAAKTMKKGEI